MRLFRSPSVLFALAALVLSATLAAAAQTSNVAVVVSTLSARSADLVLLDSGYDAGLRSGMICRVTRGNVSVGELVLVELRPQVSAALIVGLQPNQSIRNGDQVAVKVLKS
ncbi:MAG: hypothetical protein WCQ44_01305 [Opitutaceae bacterium]|jgi:hypothetical protein